MGSIPDWIQTIATILGLYLIYKTLNLQLDTLREQQRISNLELEKFELSFVPQLKVHEKTMEFSELANRFYIKFKLRCMANDLFNLQFDENMMLCINFVPPKIIPNRLAIDEEIDCLFSFHKEYLFEMAEEWGFPYRDNTIRIKFKNMRGTHFEQILWFIPLEHVEIGKAVKNPDAGGAFTR